MTIGGTAALGPLLGGWLTTSFSWRWAFGINIPLGLIVLIGTLVFVHESRDPDAAGGVDVVGALLSVVGVGLIVFGLIEGRTYGWLTTLGEPNIAGVKWTAPISPIPVAFAIGIVALIVFVTIERRRNAAGKPVLLDLSLFGIASFRNGNIAAGIASLGEFGLLFALPLWLQNVQGYSAFDTGKVLLALAGGSFLASGFGAQLTRSRGPVFVVRLGIGLEIIGVLGIGVVVSPTVSIWLVMLFLFIYGLGVGLATAQLTGVVLADVPVAASGQGRHAEHHPTSRLGAGHRGVWDGAVHRPRTSKSQQQVGGESGDPARRPRAGSDNCRGDGRIDHPHAGEVARDAAHRPGCREAPALRRAGRPSPRWIPHPRLVREPQPEHARRSDGESRGAAGSDRQLRLRRPAWGRRARRRGPCHP